MGSVKNPRPEDVALFGAPWKGAKSQPSARGVVGVMEYWSNGLELREGFENPEVCIKTVSLGPCVQSIR